jgi:hypothetical protein
VILFKILAWSIIAMLVLAAVVAAPALLLLLIPIGLFAGARRRGNRVSASSNAGAHAEANPTISPVINITLPAGTVPEGYELRKKESPK